MTSLNSSIEAPFGPFTDSAFSTAALGTAAEITLGKMVESRQADFSQREVPYIKAGNVRDSFVDTSSLGTMWASDTDIDRLNVRRDDVFVIEGGATAGRAAPLLNDSPQLTIFQNSVHRIRARNGNDQRFLRYVLSCFPESGWYEALCSTSTFKHLTSEKMKALRIPVPSGHEQRVIADFLDRETARIDALIAKKHQLSDALSERWTTEVDEIFSCDPGVPFKRLLRKPLAYGVLVPVFVDGGVPMLRISDFAGGPPDLTSVARIDPLLSQEYRRTIVEEGDLVVSVVGTLGRSAEIDSRLVGFNLNRALARVQLRREVPGALIRHWFGSSQFQRDAQLATSSDSAQPTLGLGDLKNFRIRIPEDIAEWRRLTTLLKDREAFFDATQTRLATQIGLLVEHRQGLVTAAVTGQLDIPSAA